MERTFTRATHSQLQPVEIGKRLVRAMESDQSVGVEGVIVPNVYDVLLSREDYEQFQPMQRSMAEKLEAHLARIARQRRYEMMSRPQVRLECGEALVRGDVEIKARSQDVEERQLELQYTSVLPRPEATTALPRRPIAPSLLHNGQSFAVLRSPTRVGRLPDNDIVLDDRRVSRHHAELIERGSRWMIRDTGSTNGTAVNGQVVREAALKRGDEISLGGLEVTWEQ